MTRGFVEKTKLSSRCTKRPYENKINIMRNCKSRQMLAYNNNYYDAIIKSIMLNYCCDRYCKASAERRHLRSNTVCTKGVQMIWLEELQDDHLKDIEKCWIYKKKKAEKARSVLYINYASVVIIVIIEENLLQCTRRGLLFRRFPFLFSFKSPRIRTCAYRCISISQHVWFRTKDYNNMIIILLYC